MAERAPGDSVWFLISQLQSVLMRRRRAGKIGMARSYSNNEKQLPLAPLATDGYDR